MNWTQKRLADVVELRRGFDLPHPQRRDGVVPVLSAGQAVGRHDTAMVKGPGFAIGRATNLGAPVWSDGDYWPLNTTLYAADFKGNDPRFLYWLFQVTDLTGYDSGSVQPMLNRNYIAKVEVSLPPVGEQRAIAEVLGALDNAIAAARRVAQSCLRLADACFGEALGTSTVATATYGDVAAIGGGGTPSTTVAEYWDGDIAWVTPTDVTQLDLPYLAETSRTLTSEGARASSSPLYPEGSILMTSRATIGAFALAMAPTTVNQGFIVVQARADADRWWLLHEMQGRVDYYKSHANGATFLELPRSRFKDLSVRWPDEATRTAFSQRVAPLHWRAYASSVSSKRLAALRDALLPELMSGRMRVKDAEQRVEEAI